LLASPLMGDDRLAMTRGDGKPWRVSACGRRARWRSPRAAPRDPAPAPGARPRQSWR
jgi:hypothetical protein